VRWVAEAAYAEPGPARDRSWQAIGYPQPHLARDVARIAFAARPGAEFDALVIGAGVSGSIVSGVLARAASARCSSGATTRAPAPCNPTSSKTSASRITAHQITAHEITVSLPPATPSWFVSCSRALSSRGVRLPPRSC
jgi:hypothetical protein